MTVSYDDPIRTYVRNRRNELFSKNKRCHYCGRLTRKTEERVDWAATGDHVLSRWNPLRSNTPELEQEIVLACFKCNQRLAEKEKKAAYAKYPNLPVLKNEDKIDLREYWSFLCPDTYLHEGKIHLVKDHVFFDQQIEFIGGGMSFHNCQYLRELRDAQVLRVHGVYDSLNDILTTPSAHTYACATGTNYLFNKLAPKQGILFHITSDEIPQEFLFVLYLGLDKYYIQEIMWQPMEDIFLELSHFVVRLDDNWHILVDEDNFHHPFPLSNVSKNKDLGAVRQNESNCKDQDKYDLTDRALLTLETAMECLGIALDQNSDTLKTGHHTILAYVENRDNRKKLITNVIPKT